MSDYTPHRVTCCYCGSLRYSKYMKNIRGFNFCNKGNGAGYAHEKKCHLHPDVVNFFKLLKKIDNSKVGKMRKYISW